jgi:hypothetical protein
LVVEVAAEVDEQVEEPEEEPVDEELDGVRVRFRLIGESAL